MYKKVKNGSFMNWIWFFICITPILLIFIYTLGFFNNETKEILTEGEPTTIYYNEIGTNMPIDNVLNNGYTENHTNANSIFNENITYYFYYEEYGLTDFETEAAEPLTSTNFEDFKEEPLYYFTKEEPTFITQTIYSNYEDYLTMINNTLKTNGFISNTFLNLSTYFNVSNVYYSIAAYYIEYLLIMILLHLAFDILYILPNICHKFMEKIGGERD